MFKRVVRKLHNPSHVDPYKFDYVSKKLRSFFSKKNFVEAHTQNRLSILAACEDPENLATFGYEGQLWPMPQTGQMWLEHELLKNSQLAGLFCVSTSYRNEAEPVPGRHDKIFPMFEFEMHGDINELIQLESELCHYLGFPYNVKSTNSSTNDEYPWSTYNQACLRYNTSELTHEHEQILEKDFGAVFFIRDFPESTSPFWNMARYEHGLAKKVDVILGGHETIGSAERSCDKDEMRKQFKLISNGAYANTLYAGFTKERVINELNQFLEYDFFVRSGGGIGMTRLIKAMDKYGLIPPNDPQLLTYLPETYSVRLGYNGPLL